MRAWRGNQGRISFSWKMLWSKKKGGSTEPCVTGPWWLLPVLSENQARNHKLGQNVFLQKYTNYLLMLSFLLVPSDRYRWRRHIVEPAVVTSVHLKYMWAFWVNTQVKNLSNRQKVTIVTSHINLHAITQKEKVEDTYMIACCTRLAAAGVRSRRCSSPRASRPPTCCSRCTGSLARPVCRMPGWRRLSSSERCTWGRRWAAGCWSPRTRTSHCRDNTEKKRAGFRM